ncbi:MAG TPA: cyclic nucleotide-binding domain-containing protein [bacterium]|nr:cyclic nucleotide-binding domain-containing protein [bacterium]
MSDISKEKIKEKLKQISLFKTFKEDDAALDKFTAIIDIVNFQKGDYIIKEGDQGDEMFILNKGRVSVEKRTLKDDSYTVVELTESMHVFFGELALMDSDVRSASVVALSDCECFSIRKDSFEKLGDEDTRLGLYVTREIAKLLSTRLRNANRDNITLFEALVAEIEGSGA